MKKFLFSIMAVLMVFGQSYAKSNPTLLESIESKCIAATDESPSAEKVRAVVGDVVPANATVTSHESHLCDGAWSGTTRFDVAGTGYVVEWNMAHDHCFECWCCSVVGSQWTVTRTSDLHTWTIHPKG